MNKVCNFLIFLILFTITVNVNATKEEFSKNIEKEYDANIFKSLEIINKYGEIRILDWDKPLIHIDVKITVQHDDQAKADKLLNMINIEFSEQGDQLKAVTQIDNKFGTSRGWFDSSEDKDFRIDYQVTLPKNLAVKLENKYGNIFINELTGPVEINLKYGDLNINNLGRGDEKPFNQITLAYGKANIEECNWLNFTLSYSKASFQTCRTLIVISKYSKLKIDKVSTIAGESAYDGYSIQNMDNFVITGKYSDYDINQVSKKISTETKYTKLQVAQIPSSFESINVDNDYGKISLGIDPAACYELNANVRYAKINYPDNGRVSHISQGNETKVTGYVGNEKCDSKVTINSSYGGVNLIK